MSECPNCGMLPFACVCVPWCYKHDCLADPCEECRIEGEAFAKAMIERQKLRRDKWRAVWRQVCEFFG